MYIIYCPEEDFGRNAPVVQSFYLQVSPLLIYIYYILVYVCTYKYFKGFQRKKTTSLELKVSC